MQFWAWIRFTIQALIFLGSFAIRFAQEINHVIIFLWHSRLGLSGGKFFM